MSSEEENINVEQADAQIAMKKRGGKLRRAFKWVAIAVVFLCLLPTLFVYSCHTKCSGWLCVGKSIGIDRLFRYNRTFFVEISFFVCR